MNPPTAQANPGSRSPEEALVGTFVEARRAAPAVLFLPHLHLWWQTASPALRAVLVMLLRDLPAELPLLLLATAEVPRAALDRELLRSGLFPGGAEDAVELAQPGEGQRREVLRVRRWGVWVLVGGWGVGGGKGDRRLGGGWRVVRETEGRGWMGRRGVVCR